LENQMLMTEIIAKVARNRYEAAFLFECALGNPNANPDSGSDPRLNEYDGTCMVSDVCLKALVRKMIVLAGQKVYIQQDTNFNRILAEHAEKLGISLTEKGRKAGDNLTARQKFQEEYTDARMFGAVLASGPNFGAITGPIQIPFASTIDPVEKVDVCITRACKAEDKDENKKPLVTAQQYREWEARQPASKLRGMGRKSIIRYGLFRGSAFVSAYRAIESGLTEADLELFWDSLENMFEHNRTASKGTMTCRGIAIFKHVGTAPDEAGRARQAMKGCAHAHNLFDLLRVEKKDGVVSPTSWKDYQVTFNAAGVPAGVEYRLIGAEDWTVNK